MLHLQPLCQALSITARAQRPAFVKNFLQLLCSVLTGAAEEAAQVWHAWQPCVTAVVEAHAAMEAASAAEAEVHGSDDVAAWLVDGEDTVDGSAEEGKEQGIDAVWGCHHRLCA